MKDTLFLLKPGFLKGESGPFYCADCAALEGVLSFFPELRTKLDVRYIDFTRPRAPLVELLGEANQSAPSLVMGDAPGANVPSDPAPAMANGKRFLNDPADIRRYLSSRYGVPQAS